MYISERVFIYIHAHMHMHNRNLIEERMVRALQAMAAFGIARLHTYIHTYIHTYHMHMHNRNLIEKRMARASQAMAVFGIAGLCFAIAQNELVIRGHDPHSDTINALKVSVHTRICMYVCIQIVYEGMILIATP